MRYFICLLLLAGCSGGSSAGSDVTRREPFVPIVPIDDPSPTGSATYEGRIALGFFAPSTGASVDLRGDLSIAIDFDNMDSAITGAATGFRDDAGEYVGNLLVQTAALDDASGGLDFATNINGSLATGTTNYLVVGQMRGEVLGTSQEAASGQISGVVQERGVPANLSGQFQTARRP